MGTRLSSEIEFFNKVEPELIKNGRVGYFVVIHDHQILAEGRDAEEAVKNLRRKYHDKPPEPLLVRQVLGEERRPYYMRSPKLGTQIG